MVITFSDFIENILAINQNIFEWQKISFLHQVSRIFEWMAVQENHKNNSLKSSRLPLLSGLIKCHYTARGEHDFLCTRHINSYLRIDSLPHSWWGQWCCPCGPSPLLPRSRRSAPCTRPLELPSADLWLFGTLESLSWYRRYCGS